MATILTRVCDTSSDQGVCNARSDHPIRFGRTHRIRSDDEPCARFVFDLQALSDDPLMMGFMNPAEAFLLGDGGPHAGPTCNASTMTYLLSYRARDRSHGRLPVELAVQKLTSATASLEGLGDRGFLPLSMIGDVNVIGFDNLQLRRPERVADPPGGAERLVQEAGGYVQTVKSGVVTFSNSEHTGAVPGDLLRGAR